MEKFVESFHCERISRGSRCRICRDTSEKGYRFRESLGTVLELPESKTDFACPYGVPWDYKNPPEEVKINQDVVGATQAHVVDTCVSHTTWCEKYGLPTSESACEVCTAERTDIESGPEFCQLMRTIGMFYGALECIHREFTGRTENRGCCGGQVKDVPIYNCKLTGLIANCGRCPNRTIGE